MIIRLFHVVMWFYSFLIFFMRTRSTENHWFYQILYTLSLFEQYHRSFWCSDRLWQLYKYENGYFHGTHSLWKRIRRSKIWIYFIFHVTLSAMSITSHYNDVTENQIEIQLLNFSKLSNDSRNRMCKKPTCSPNFPL